MKPIWRDGKLTVELHKPDKVVLQKARDLGSALVVMQQETGQALVDAVDLIVGSPQPPEEPEQEDDE